MWLTSNASNEINRILYFQYASGDVVVTPVFYRNNSSSSLFVRLDYKSNSLQNWMQKDAIEDWQKTAAYEYAFFINHNSYWWKIEEDNPYSITEFISQYRAISSILSGQGVEIKNQRESEEHIKVLSDALFDLKRKQDDKDIIIEKIVETQEKLVGISRNDIISIYELASQCCSAYNNLIMLIDKKNASKYVSYAKGTLKQSQYTQDIAEAKYWTEKIKAFTKPMADFCESMNALYEKTRGIDSKFGSWDSEQPYGKATDFPLLTRAVIHIEALIKNIPDIIKKGEDAEYIKHLQYMANRQRIY